MRGVDLYHGVCFLDDFHLGDDCRFSKLVADFEGVLGGYLLGTDQSEVDGILREEGARLPLPYEEGHLQNEVAAVGALLGLQSDDSLLKKGALPQLDFPVADFGEGEK